MGNRANVVFYQSYKDGKVDTSQAVYLHWNGGPESVFAFIKEMDRRQIRKGDLEYECARFVQLVGDFFDQTKHEPLSLGILLGPIVIEGSGNKEKLVPSLSDKALKPLDHGDNGVYLINRSEGIYRRFKGGSDGRLIDEVTLESAYEFMENDQIFKNIGEVFKMLDKKLYGEQTERNE